MSRRSVILDCHWLTQIILTSDWLIADRTSWTDSDREVSQLTSDPIEESEVLNSLDQDYYKQDWDSSTHWLTLLGDDAKDLDTIDKARKDLIKQLTTVSRRVFSLILSKQTDCARQQDHIVRVEKQLKAGLSVCQVKLLMYPELRIRIQASKSPLVLRPIDKGVNIQCTFQRSFRTAPSVILKSINLN